MAYLNKYGLLLLLFAGLLPVNTWSQVKIEWISPAATADNIREVHGPHVAMYNPSAHSRHRLLFMIEGTGASAASCRVFDSCFAEMGYHVVSIDYPNNVITTTCSGSTDSSCFDGYRQEIVFGTPASSLVDVDAANSIVSRFTKLLRYLSAHDKAGGWDAFLQGAAPRWDHIIVAGHSQGAGHAAYLGKAFQLAGVLMLSGPQDYLRTFQTPAPWQFRKGLTPAARQYAFLHVKDPFNYQFQVADVAAVTGLSPADTTMVQPGIPVHSDRHIFVNTWGTKDYHGSTVNPAFVQVWQYIMDRLQ
ncbi:BPSS1187 family protein [Niabella ginsenosidivorans]|nr:hypothetical protein [Niabella ginsenosidivorans]